MRPPSRATTRTRAKTPARPRAHPVASRHGARTHRTPLRLFLAPARRNLGTPRTTLTIRDPRPSPPRRRLVSPPPANPWTRASGASRSPSARRDVDRDAVRDSWREKQTDLEDVSAAEAFEAARKRRDTEDAARARKSAASERAANETAASAGGGDVIDLIDDDDEEDEENRDRSEKADRKSVADKKASRAKSPTRAELAAAAKARRDSRLASASAASRPPARRHTPRGNPLLDPPRYEPDPSSAPTAADLRLRTDEACEVRDVGMGWVPLTACLDTGNAGCTLIHRSAAILAGLCDGFGRPTGGARGSVEVRGVVEGAAERIPRTTIAYRIKGKVMVVEAGITNAAMGCDLLVARSDIAEFERDGYTLTAR